MERCTKLLVHAGAPSSRKEDEAYIAQAEAYLALAKPGRAIATRRSCEARSLSIVETGVDLTGESTDHEDSTTIPANEAQVQSTDNVDQRQQAGFQRTSTKRARVPDSCEYIDDTQLAYTFLESQLFTSSTVAARAFPAQSRKLESTAPVATAVTTDVTTTVKNDQECIGSGRVEDTPPAVQAEHHTPNTSPRRRAGSAPISESSYIPTPLLERSSKRQRRPSPRRIDLQPGSRIRQPIWQPPPVPYIAGQASDVIVRQPGCENSAEDTIISDETTSELPASFSVSDLVSNSRSNSLPDRAHHGRSNGDPGPLAHSLGESSFDPPYDLLQSQPHGPVSDHHTVETSPSNTNVTSTNGGQLDLGAILERAQEQVPPISTHEIARVVGDTRSHYDQPPADDVAEAEPEVLELATEIHAPQPKTSVKQFKTHVTKELQSLHESFGTKYRPSLVSRQISVHERGHWLVDCSSWRTTKKLALWRHLETWIGNGSAGWGIWCTRGSDQHLVPRDSLGQASGIAATRREFRFLRVYCWGEVVGHVYILLYTASEGSVRKLGLHWIDSKGDVVVDMKPPTG